MILMFSKKDCPYSLARSIKTWDPKREKTYFQNYDKIPYCIVHYQI